MEPHGKLLFVPVQHFVVDAEGYGIARGGFGKIIAHDERRKIYDARHHIGLHGLADIAVLQRESQRMVGIVAAGDLGDHGIVGRDIIPHAAPGLIVQIYHFLDLEDLALEQIDKITLRLVRGVVVHGHDLVVHIPPPVFIPGQRVAHKTAVCFGGKAVMHRGKGGIVPGDAPHFSRHRLGLGQLIVPNAERHFVRHDLPALVTVKGDGVRAQERDALSAPAHIGERLADERAHQADARVFRIGGHAGDEPGIQQRAFHIYLHGIYGDLRGQRFALEAAQYMG